MRIVDERATRYDQRIEERETNTRRARKPADPRAERRRRLRQAERRETK